MTRAEGAHRTRTSLLWRSSAPRTPRRTLALAFVALATTGGLATAANANGLLGGLLGGNVPLLSSLLGSPAPATGNCSANGLVAVGAGALSDCSGSTSSAGQANCSAAGGVAVSAAVLSDCTRRTATAGGDAAAAQYEEPGAECDGLLNARAQLLRDINALLLVLPEFDERIVDLRVQIEALDTKIRACLNLP